MKAEDFGYVVKNNVCLFQRGPFSQWYGAYDGQVGGFKVELKDQVIEFNCAEQAMMAAKASIFRDEEALEKIMATNDPKEQKALGREVKGFKDELWNQVRYEVVLSNNVLKFSQNEELLKFLAMFHEQTIFAEAAPWDKVWGIGLGPDDPRALDIYQWQGENLLGKVIGEIRRNIK